MKRVLIMKRKRIFIPALLMAWPVCAFADGGGPLLLLIDFYIFSVGQVWIVAAEFFYLAKIWQDLSRMIIAKWTILTNLISAILGAMIFPFLWSALFGLLSIVPGISGHEAEKILMAIGTWLVGDNSKYAWLAMAASAILFAATYFVTVKIEYLLLNYFMQEDERPEPITMKQVYIMNLISYIGLVVLFAAGMLWSR